MNMNFSGMFHTKKFRHGSVSLALTVAIIAAVILLNAIFTALSNKFLWFIDMTSEQIYTLSDEAKELLRPMGESGREVTVTFCSEKDVLEANATQRYVLYSVLEIADEYANVKPKYVDVITNPSAVSDYKQKTGQDINSQTVIVSSGTECRVFSLSAFFTKDSSGQEVIGYNGEQRLVSAMLAVTQADMPVACVTTNHGEAEALQNSAILNLLYEAGYEIKPIDLLREEIPADCRMMLVFDPQADFTTKTSASDISELSKLSAFLDEQNSLMVFFDYDTPVLENFEAFLDEWGIAIAREEDTTLLIKDTANSFTVDGLTNVATYSTGGLGGSINAALREKQYPKSVIFRYAGAIKNPASYEVAFSETNQCFVGTYYYDGVDRTSYDVFTSSTDAVALAGDKTLSRDELNSIGVNNPALNVFSYMKVTCETKMIDNNPVYSYVLACSSTQFASNSALDTSYGNHAVLTYAASMLGRSVITVSLDCKYFSDLEISNITAKDANQYTVVLTVVPASVIFIAGIYIMVRRKYA